MGAPSKKTHELNRTAVRKPGPDNLPSGARWMSRVCRTADGGACSALVTSVRVSMTPRTGRLSLLRAQSDRAQQVHRISRLEDTLLGTMILAEPGLQLRTPSKAPRNHRNSCTPNLKGS